MICLVVMYTDKVLRPCHMLMLDNTFWAEKLMVVVVMEGGRAVLGKDGGRGGGGGQQMVSCSNFSPGFILMVIGSSLVILGLTSRSPAQF